MTSSVAKQSPVLSHLMHSCCSNETRHQTPEDEEALVERGWYGAARARALGRLRRRPSFAATAPKTRKSVTSCPIPARAGKAWANRKAIAKIITYHMGLCPPWLLLLTMSATSNFNSNTTAQQECPWVYFIHRKPNKGHIVQGFDYPPGGPMLRKNCVPDKFQILPLCDADTCNTDGSTVARVSAPATKTAYLEQLQSWQTVAIRNSSGRYLSCRKICPLTGGALAEYRSKIGDYEKFRLRHHPGTGTYSFQSHNGLYLHYNSVLGTVAFKVKPSDENEREQDDSVVSPISKQASSAVVDNIKTSWHIIPLGLRTSDTEHILSAAVFGIGVKSREADGSIDLTKPLMERTTEGEVRPRWESGHLAAKLKVVSRILGPGQCTMFYTEADANTDTANDKQNIKNDQRLLVVTKDEENLTMNVVAVTSGYPLALAAEFVEDLSDAYKSMEELEFREGFDQIKIDRIAGTRLAALMYNHDDTYLASSHCAAVQEIHDVMRSNIEKLQANILNESEILEVSKELEANARRFKKLSEQAYSKPSALYFVGGAAGHVGAALLIGDVTLLFDVLVPLLAWTGIYAGASATSRYWKRRFVRVTE